MPPMSTPVRMFVSYAHTDGEARDELEKHCALLIRQGLLSIWSDPAISPGREWKTEIDSRLDEADIVLLLVTASFIDSDYCFGIELERALTRHKAGAARIVPVIVSPCDWEESPFGCLQALPERAIPVTTWRNPDEAWAAVAKGLRELIHEIRAAPAPAGGQTAPEPSDEARQVSALAREYERIRLRLPKGDRRSLAMETVFLRMRGLVCSAWAALPEMIASPSPGERLCAVALLQVRPDIAYSTFIVECIERDKPFVGHRAVEALQCCARLARGEDRTKVLRLAERAFKAVRHKPKSARSELLQDLLQELRRFPERPDVGISS